MVGIKRILIFPLPSIFIPPTTCRNIFFFFFGVSFVTHNMFSVRPKTSLRAGGTHLVVLARSVAAYLHAALDMGDLDKVSRALNQHTTKALMTIFR